MPVHGGRDLVLRDASPGRSDSLSRGQLSPHHQLLGGGTEPSPLALQVNILRGRLAQREADLTKLKGDLEQSREKALQLGIKLNAEAREKVGLTSKYQAVLARMREIEERVRESGEVATAERRRQREFEREVEQFKELLRQKQAALDSKDAALAALQVSAQDRELGWRDDIERSQERTERLRALAAQSAEQCSVMVADAFERLEQDRGAKEAEVTVLCSELHTAASDNSQTLQRLELQVGKMREQLQQAQESEEEYSQILATMLRENRELWAQLEQRKQELARHKEDERRREQRSVGQRLQEQVETLTQDKRRLEDRLREANEKLQQHINKVQEHERNFDGVIESLRASDEEKHKLSQTLASLESGAEAMREQFAAMQRTVDDSQRELDAARQERAALQREYAGERERWRQELQAAVQGAAREGDTLREELRHIAGELDTVRVDRERLARDAQHHQQQLEAARANAEGERALQLAQLREELAAQRQFYEREVEGLQREAAARASELSQLQRASDKERFDASSARMELQGLRQSCEDLRHENQSLHEESKALLEERQSRARELEERRAQVGELQDQLQELGRERARAAAALEEERRRQAEAQRTLEQQVQRLTRQCEEGEARRGELERERRALLAERERAGTRKVEELERAKALLVRENERVLAQYRDVNEANTRLLSENKKLQERAQSDAALQQELAEHRRQLAQRQLQAEESRELRDALARAQEETEELRQERDATQQRLDRLLDESKRRDYDSELPGYVEAADQQIRRLEQQMEQATLYSARPRSTRSPGGMPLSAGSPTGRLSLRSSPMRPTH